MDALAIVEARRLATSATGAWSASRRIFTICSSLNRVFFMAPRSLARAIFSRIKRSDNRQAGQAQLVYALDHPARKVRRP